MSVRSTPTYSWSSADSSDFIPAHNQILNSRYKIIAQLGVGAYSVVWKCIDLYADIPKEVAVKIHKSDPECARVAKLEWRFIAHIAHPNILAAIDMFAYYDAEPTSQKYYCIVYELCDGGDLEKNMPLQLNTTALIMRQLLAGLAELHSHQIMHLDIKPENILIVNGNDPVFKLADFSAAEFTYAATSGIVGTRYYRAPEILLGLPHTPACDIWAIGCLLFELCTGDILFKPHQYRNYKITRDEDHLAQMIELIGELPKWMLIGPRRKLLLSKNGKPRHIPQLYPWRLARVMHDRYNITDLALIDLLQNMLALDPNKRPTAKQCLAHPWLHSTGYQN